MWHRYSRDYFGRLLEALHIFSPWLGATQTMLSLCRFCVVLGPQVSGDFPLMLSSFLSCRHRSVISPKLQGSPCLLQVSSCSSPRPLPILAAPWCSSPQAAAALNSALCALSSPSLSLGPGSCFQAIAGFVSLFFFSQGLPSCDACFQMSENYFLKTFPPQRSICLRNVGKRILLT